MVAVGLIAILDAVILHQFIGSMQRFRDRIDWIHKKACPSKEQKPLRLDEADSLLNTSLYIHFLILISLAGSVIAGWAIWNIKAAGAVVEHIARLEVMQGRHEQLTLAKPISDAQDDAPVGV